MRVLSIVHEDSAGSGVFAEAARERRDQLLEWTPALQGHPPPGAFDAALVFGGATHADQEQQNSWLRIEKDLLGELMRAGTPALGVCLGAQLLAQVAGGRVTRMPAPEIGWTPVALAPAARADPLLAALPQQFDGFQWHSYEVSIPPDGVALASSASCLQAFALNAVPWWGIQFHAEATGETIGGWIADYRSDPDALAADIDWSALAARSGREIARWNELGRLICGNFLARAQALAGPGGADAVRSP